MKKFCIALALSAGACAVASAADSGYKPGYKLGYKLGQQLVLGKKTKWDYAAIDQVRHRLFVTRGDHVDVLDLLSGKQIGAVTQTNGVHGVAFAQDLKLGFTSNGKTNSVSVFDLETLATVGEIALTGKNPDAILYEPSVKKLYVFNGGSKNVDIVDATSRKVIGTVQATGTPEFAVSDERGKIYFNIEDNAGINVIDATSNKRLAAWKLDKCEEPTGLAIDVLHNRLFSTCQNGIMAVTDTLTGKRVGQFAIGAGPDAAAYDAESGTVFTSGGGGNGSLTITHQEDANHYAPSDTLVTAQGARTMAMDTTTKRVYLPTVTGEQFIVLVVEPLSK